MRTEITMVPLHKYFVTCPRCEKERAAYSGSVDSLCSTCQRIEEDSENKKYEDMFNQFQANMNGAFTYSKWRSREFKSCCIDEYFTLVGKDGTNYYIDAYEDDGRIVIEVRT